jgi:predicted solute-binding protein
VRQRGKETYKLKLTNKNYKYYKLLESGKQVVGLVSTQASASNRNKYQKHKNNNVSGE